MSRQNFYLQKKVTLQKSKAKKGKAISHPKAMHYAPRKGKSM